jgi:FAD:protein FMN transferase
MHRVAEFEAIGTHWTLDLPEALDPEVVSGVLREVRERIDRFDQSYSRFRADSIVTAISKAAGTYVLPVDAIPMMAFYRELYQATDGAVTPLIGNVLSDAGYDATYSLVERPMTSPKAWDDVMVWNPATCELTVHEPVLLDFGAAGKGYCVDIVATLLESRGIHSFVVDAGGDVCHRDLSRMYMGGGGGLNVGLENPSDISQAIGVAIIRNQSICGSAGNRRRWGRFHHTIDPRTLQSPTELAAVWVVASSTMLADGLTTALQFVLPGQLERFGAFEYAVLNHHGLLATSSGFPAEFFLVS